MFERLRDFLGLSESDDEIEPVTDEYPPPLPEGPYPTIETMVSGAIMSEPEYDGRSSRRLDVDSETLASKLTEAVEAAGRRRRFKKPVASIHNNLDSGIYRTERPAVGFKKVLKPSRAATRRRRDGLRRDAPTQREQYIAALIIPSDTLVVCGSRLNDKLRAEKAYVAGMYCIERPHTPTSHANSSFDMTFAYTRGEMVRPHEKFDTRPTETCASGIHFFAEPREAMYYNG